MTHRGGHYFTVATAVPGYKRCGMGSCKEVQKVDKPALAVVGSPTSEEAARRIEGGPRTRARDAVFAAISQSTEGLTAERISELTGISGDTVRPRIVELFEAARIKKSGKTRLTRAGRESQVWVVCE